MNKVTMLWTHRAYKLDEESEATVRMAAEAYKLPKYYVCGFGEADEVTPVTIISETCNFESAKTRLANNVHDRLHWHIVNLNATGEDRPELSTICKDFVIYLPGSDVFLQFADDFETIIGIHPAELLHKKADYTVNPEN
jgi:hypothetical protein